MKEEQKYWTDRYNNEKTGWDIGYPSTPLKTYIDQLSDKEIKILIPGAGNAYEAEYLFQNGFNNVFVMDISQVPLLEFSKRNPGFLNTHLLCEDFLEHEGKYDLILEQTFFCSLVPTNENRTAYAQKMHDLLKENEKLVGLWFDIPLKDDLEKRPFGGDKELYLSYLEPFLEKKTFEKCYNSIEERRGTELFGIFVKK